MTAPRTTHITCEPDGTLHSTHLGQPITFWSPEDLWNFCTLQVSRDRQFFARPPTRNQEEEAEAIVEWQKNHRPPTQEELRALVLHKLRSQRDDDSI